MISRRIFLQETSHSPSFTAIRRAFSSIPSTRRDTVERSMLISAATSTCGILSRMYSRAISASSAPSVASSSTCFQSLASRPSSSFGIRIRAFGIRPPLRVCAISQAHHFRRAELACHIIMPEDVAVRHVILSAKLVHQRCCLLQRLLRGHHLAVALRVAHLNADGICISAARVLVPVRPAVICHKQGIL